MAPQTHLICSLWHCLFLPFFFIFVMHLDHSPPEIFLTCTLEAFLSTLHLNSTISTELLTQRKSAGAATPVFFHKYRAARGLQLEKKSISSQCYSGTTKTWHLCWGPIWNKSDHLIFCDEKTNSAAPERSKHEKL